jgi:hypothetical protein
MQWRWREAHKRHWGMNGWPLVLGLMLSAVSGQLYGFEKHIGQLEHMQEIALPADTTLRRDADNGTVVFLRARNLSEGIEREEAFRALQATRRFSDVALAFLMVYRQTFHLQHPASELRVTSVTSDSLGLTHVRFQQVFASIPVRDAELLVHLDQAAHVTLMQGRYIPTPTHLDTHPTLRQEDALQRVATDLARPTSACPQCQVELVIFPSATDSPRLAYRVVTTVSLAEGWAFMIDAHTGQILEKKSTIQY